MFLRPYSWAGLLCAATAGVLAQPSELRLCGIAQGANGPWVLLAEPATGRSRWRAPGESFAGYVVATCDARTGEVSLVRQGSVSRLRLDSSPIASAADDQDRISAAIQTNLRSLAAAGYQRCVETGQRQVRFAEIVGRELPIFRLESVAGEDYSNLVVSLHDRHLSVITRDGRVVEWQSHEPVAVQMAPGTSLANLSSATGISPAELAARNPGLPTGGTFPVCQPVVLP